jgi:hypothetical protein
MFLASPDYSFTVPFISKAFVIKGGSNMTVHIDKYVITFFIMYFHVHCIWLFGKILYGNIAIHSSTL